MQPWFIATERFGPWRDDWLGFVEWSGLTQLEELVSLDAILCPTVLPETKSHYWPHIVDEDHFIDYFVDLDFLLAEVEGVVEKSVLCVFRDPPDDPVAPPDPPFQLVGYDVVDSRGGPSALSNCGGFPQAFSATELTRHGLLASRTRAVEVRAALKQHYPHEPHAQCLVWAIFRADASPSSSNYRPPDGDPFDPG